MNSKDLPIFLGSLVLVGVVVIGILKTSNTAPSDNPHPGQSKPASNAVNKPTAKPGEMVTTGSGLQYLIEAPGTGTVATPGHTVVVNYTGSFTNGTVFDSTASHGAYTFALGAGTVIPAWDEGLTGMKVGEKRRLLVPPELGYGENGHGETIPPNTPLIFEVELLDVKN